MKLNLPSTWTSQKMSALFLLSFLKAHEVKTGQTFKDCLVSNNVTKNGTNLYNSLTSFPFSNYEVNITNGNFLTLCCGSSPCSLAANNGMCTDLNEQFWCRKIVQAIYCSYSSNSWGCGGIAGDNLITGNYTSDATKCPSIQAVANSLIGVVPDHGFVDKQCTGDSRCAIINEGDFYCFWDNGGWNCIDCSACVANPCFLQWVASSPTLLSSTLTSAAISSSNSSTFDVSLVTSSDVSSITPPANNPNLTIIIPVAVGGSAIIATATGCYLIRKKRKNNSLSQKNENEETLVLPTSEEIELPVYSLSPPNEIEEREAKNSPLQKPNAIEELRTGDAERGNNYQQLLTKLRTKLGNQQELLDNFLDAQEILQNNSNLASSQRNFQRAKLALAKIITWDEMNALENPAEQLIAQMEVAS